LQNGPSKVLSQFRAAAIAFTIVTALRGCFLLQLKSQLRETLVSAKKLKQ
jgi:hypothetical protein